jgi:two-component system LytT family sensor kinase
VRGGRCNQPEPRCNAPFVTAPSRQGLSGVSFGAMEKQVETGRDWLTNRRTLFALASAVWLTFALIHVFQTSVLADATGRDWTLRGGFVYAMPWWLSWLVLTPLIAYLAARFPFTEGNPWRSLAAHALFGAVISTVQVIVVGTIFWYTVGQYAASATSLANQVQRFFGNFFLESIVTYAGTAGVFTAIDFARAVRDEVVRRAQSEARAAALESSVAQARVDALSMQMNPHFLFNTLTAISGLVAQERKAEAREVIQRLGELLRQSLGNGNGPFSTVAREAALLEDYLYIQRIRFSDRLDAAVDIDLDARECLIPTMLLQPLVENAIRHGVEPREGKGRVRVSVSRDNGAIRIRIVDSGTGFVLGADGRPVREGIGIANTRERLEHMYGSGASLQLRNVEGGGAEAVVLIPSSPGSASVAS